MINRSEGRIIKAPKVCIDLSCMQKIHYFVGACPTEINGFGMVDIEQGNLVTNEIFLLKQLVSDKGYKVDNDPVDLNRYISELVSKDGDPSKMKFQWHSHVWEDVYFSERDLATIESYMCDYMISLVINKRGEYICRLDLFKPIRVAMEVPLLVRMAGIDQKLVQEYEREMRENVLIKKAFWSKAVEPDSWDRYEELYLDIDECQQD